MKKEYLTALSLLGLQILISAVYVYLFMQLLKLQTINWIYGVAIFIFLLIIITTINNKWPNKISAFALNLITAPMAVIYTILTFILPIITLAVHVMIYFIIVILIPLIIYRFNLKMQIFNIETATYLFITISFSAISAVVFYKYILNLLLLISPIRLKTSQKLKRFRMKELTEYVLTPQHIRFMIYMAYLLYIIPFSYNTLQHKSIFATSEIDFAIMQSFLVFLAFDSLRVNIKSVNLSAKVLLWRTLQGFINENENNKKDDSQ